MRSELGHCVELVAAFTCLNAADPALVDGRKEGPKSLAHGDPDAPDHIDCTLGMLEYLLAAGGSMMVWKIIKARRVMATTTVNRHCAHTEMGVLLRR